MTYLEIRAAGHAILIAAPDLARIAPDAPPGPVTTLPGSRAPAAYVHCTDGRVLAADEVRPTVELPDHALLPVPWLPQPAAALFDAYAPGHAGGAWRLRPDWVAPDEASRP